MSAVPMDGIVNPRRLPRESRTSTTGGGDGGNMTGACGLQQGSQSQPFFWIDSLIRAAFLFAVLTGVKHFEIWDSVRQFIDYDPWLYLSTPLSELTQNAWWIRTGLVIPALVVGELTPLGRDLSFGLCAAGALFLAIRNTNSAIDGLLGLHPGRTILTTVFMLSVGWFMNGRICFAILGASVLYVTHFRWFRGEVGTWRLLLANVVALVLMTVSTGAFYVGVAITMTTTLLALRDPRPGLAKGCITINSTLAILPSLALIVHQASLFNDKLARWHDGDYLMIVYHGPLMLIERYVPAVPAELVLCGIAAGTLCSGVLWLGYATSFPVTHTYLATTVVLGIVCGAFGWSTLLTNLPGYLIFSWMVLKEGHGIRPSKF